jgi:hypothetical protein
MADLKTVDELCAENRLSHETLAAKAGLDLKRMQAILEGRWTPSPVERDRVAAVFGLSRAGRSSVWAWAAVWQNALRFRTLRPPVRIPNVTQRRHVRWSALVSPSTQSEGPLDLMDVRHIALN